MSVEDRVLPELKSDEVKIRVKAAGVNFADLMMRMGLYPEAPEPPFVPGYEVSGVVEAVGEAVRSFQIGQRVMAMTRFGGYAEEVHVRLPYVRVIPENLSFEMAAAIPVNYLTAWCALFPLGQVKPGQAVFIHHILGGVGLAATQLAKTAGCKVIGSTSTHEKVAAAKDYGMDHVFNYRQHDFAKEARRFTEGEGVHLVLDATGGQNLKKDMQALRPAGRVILYGASSLVSGEKRSIINIAKALFSTPWINPFWLLSQNRGVFGLNLLKLYAHLDLLNEGISYIEDALKKGQIKPVLANVFPFKEVAQAHRFLQKRQNIGKVVLSF